MKNTIPYLEVSYPDRKKKFWQVWVLTSIVLLFSGFVAGVVYMALGKFTSTVAIVTLYISMVGLLGFAFSKLIDKNAAELRFALLRDRNANAKKMIENAYNITLSDKEFQSLAYPNEKPGSETQTYGTFSRDSEIEENKVATAAVYILCSDQGEFYLKCVTPQLTPAA